MLGYRERWVRYAVAVVAFGVVAWAWHYGTRQSGGIRPAGERRVMPELVMAQLDGGTWRTVDHRGQVVLLNYWATWCGPCWEETPGLVRLSREMGPKGLAVVGVAIDVLEQRRERRAELEAQAAAVTEVVHACEFLAEVAFDEVLRIKWVIRRGHTDSGRERSRPGRTNAFGRGADWFLKGFWQDRAKLSSVRRGLG